MTTPDLSFAAPVSAGAIRVRRPMFFGAVLALGCLAACAATAIVASDAGARVAAADPDLARLLRAMAIVKGVLLSLAVVALGWRLRRPVVAFRLAAYLLLPWVAAAALGAMWQLTALGIATVVLHGAGVALLAVAWRDPDFLPATRSTA